MFALFSSAAGFALWPLFLLVVTLRKELQPSSDKTQQSFLNRREKHKIPKGMKVNKHWNVTPRQQVNKRRMGQSKNIKESIEVGHQLPLIPPWRHPRTSTNSFRKPRNSSCGTVVAPTSTGIPPQGCISWSCEEQAGRTVSKTVGKILEGPISTCTYLPQKGHKSEQPVIMSMFITPWRFSNLCFW